ncbi:hypothetical protein ACWZEH_21560 [Streptomyces sp. QTS137]
MAVPREDRFLVAGDGTPWTRTDPAPDVTDDDILRRRAPRRVHDRLEDDGFLGEEPEPAAFGGDGARAGGVVWWAGRGARGGAARTLLTRRGAVRRRGGPPRGEPRQEPIGI